MIRKTINGSNLVHPMWFIFLQVDQICSIKRSALKPNSMFGWRERENGVKPKPYIFRLSFLLPLSSSILDIPKTPNKYRFNRNSTLFVLPSILIRLFELHINFKFLHRNYVGSKYCLHHYHQWHKTCMIMAREKGLGFRGLALALHFHHPLNPEIILVLFYTKWAKILKEIYKMQWYHRKQSLCCSFLYQFIVKELKLWNRYI